MRSTGREYNKRDARALAIFTHHKFQVDGLIPKKLAFYSLLDPTSTMSATYGVAFQQQFREGTLPWSARPSTFIIDRDGVLRYADDYEDRTPLWTPLQLLDEMKEQRRLITSLASIDKQYSETVKLSLAPLGKKTKSVLPVLMEALTSDNVDVRRGATAALYWVAGCAGSAVQPLGKALDDEDEQVRHLAVLALGRIGRAAESHLVAALKHNDVRLRVRAARDLSQISSLQPESIDALIAALADKSQHVRIAVVRSLLRLPMDLRTRLPVLNALATALTDPAQPVQHDAAYGLRAMGSRARAGVPLITKALRHKNYKIRIWGAIVLRTMGPDAKEAIPDLVHNAIHNTGNPRNRALDALKAIGPDATSALLAKLSSTNEAERAKAAFALGYNHSEDDRVVKALAESLQDNSPRVCLAAATALGEFGAMARSARPALTELLKDNDERIQTAAKKSLRLIDSPATDE